MYCRYCGAELPDNAVSCSRCGKSFISPLENTGESQIEDSVQESEQSASSEYPGRNAQNDFSAGADPDVRPDSAETGNAGESPASENTETGTGAGYSNWANTEYGQPDTSGWNGRNTGSSNQSQNGWNTQNNGGWDQNPNGWNTQNNGGWNQNPDGWNTQNSGGWDQNPNGWNTQNSGGWNQNPNGWNTQNNGGWNQNPNGWNTQNSGPWNQGGGMNYPYSQEPKTTGYAIASLVLGIVGIFFNFFFVTPALAIVFGVIGRKQIRQYPNELKGDGLALAGIILGIIAIILTIVTLVLLGSMMSYFYY
jgi:hypothetical protein